MSEARKIMSFDWALKTVLRDKANFDVLEGFLSALLKQDVQIEEILESESNRADEVLKSNQVDLLVKTGADERIIVEVQYSLEPDFLQRLLYGVSKVIVEHLQKGQPYAEVKKVISVSVVHFDIGFDESDYVYHGTTEFRGIHSQHLMVREPAASYGVQNAADLKSGKDRLFPEYYIIPVKQFNDVVGDDLDEWIYSLKNSEVPGTFKARNIDKMREKLDVLHLDAEERRRYDKYLLRRASDEGVIRLNFEKGREEGREEGLEEGAQDKATDIARALLDILDDETIAAKTGLTVEQVKALRNAAEGVL